MDDFDQTRADIASANAVAQEAQALRHRLRRKLPPGHGRRQEALLAAHDAIDAAMKPVRSYVGRLQWEAFPSDVEAGLREVSANLQHQRRQIKKMLR